MGAEDESGCLGGSLVVVWYTLVILLLLLLLGIGINRMYLCGVDGGGVYWMDIWGITLLKVRFGGR